MWKGDESKLCYGEGVAMDVDLPTTGAVPLQVPSMREGRARCLGEAGRGCHACLSRMMTPNLGN